MLASWDQYKNHVQPGLKEGQFTSAEHILLAAGPPHLYQIGSYAEELGISGALNDIGTWANRLTGAAGAIAGEGLGAAVGAVSSTAGALYEAVQGTTVYPLGQTQQIALGQNTNIMRLFEIGSRRSYFITGRSVGQLSVRKAWYHGASILRLMYAYHQSSQGENQFPSMFGSNLTSHPDNINSPIYDSPGYDNFFVNLASDLFSRPIGLLMTVRDNTKQTLGMAYFEQCYIPTHGFTLDAASVLVQEQITLNFERIVPVQAAGVDLLGILTDVLGG